LSTAKAKDRDFVLHLVERAQRGDKSAFNDLASKYRPRLVRAITASSDDFEYDDHVVQDIVQDTLKKAYRRLHTFLGDSVFYTWLETIGINTAKDYFRQRQRKTPFAWTPPTNDSERETLSRDRSSRPLSPVTVPEFFSEGRRRAQITNDSENILVEGRPSPKTGRPAQITMGQLASVEGSSTSNDLEDQNGFEDPPENTLASEENLAMLDDVVRRLPQGWYKAITLQLEGLSYQEIAIRMNLPKNTVGSMIFRARKALAARVRLAMDNQDIPLSKIGDVMRQQQNRNLVNRRIYDLYKSGAQRNPSKS